MTARAIEEQQVEAPVAAPGRRTRARSPAGLAIAYGPRLVPWLMLVSLLAIYEDVQGGVFTRYELNTDSAATLTLLLVATGQTIVILLGGIDLSVGGVVSLSTSLAATRVHGSGWTMAGWAAAILGLGVLGGAVNGLLVARLRLQPFIVTLATWSIFSGTALWVLPTEGGTIPQGFINWMNAKAIGVQTPVWLLVALVLFWLWFSRTRLGVAVRATGSSPGSSFLSGVPTGAVTVAAYALSGLFATLAGLYLTTQTASGSPTVGNDYILTSVAAVIIGGTSLFGGRGGLGGTIAGAFILTIIGDVIFALNVSSFWTPIISGLLLILAVLANSLIEIYARRRVL